MFFEDTSWNPTVKLIAVSGCISRSLSVFCNRSSELISYQNIHTVVDFDQSTSVSVVRQNLSSNPERSYQIIYQADIAFNSDFLSVSYHLKGASSQQHIHNLNIYRENRSNPLFSLSVSLNFSTVLCNLSGTVPPV